MATDFFVNALHSDSSNAQNVTELFTTMKPIEPVDVADAVVYILSTPAHVQVRTFFFLMKRLTKYYPTNRFLGS